jgi:hypothetical protein
MAWLGAKGKSEAKLKKHLPLVPVGSVLSANIIY